MGVQIPCVYQTGVNRGRQSYSMASFTGNRLLNAVLNKKLNKAFEQQDASSFIGYINKQFKNLTVLQAQKPVDVHLSGGNQGGTLQDCVEMKPAYHAGHLTVQLQKNGRVQLQHQLYGNIFIQGDELAGIVDKTNAEIIGNGVRFLDPADQSQWTKMAQLGRDWPPDAATTLGPIHLFPDKYHQAVLFDTASPVGDAYNVKTRGLVFTNPERNAMTLAVQQLNKNHHLKTAPWIIAPFKVPDRKKALAVFPVHSQLVHQYNKGIEGSLRDIVGNPQWILDRKRKLMFIDPSAKANTMAGVFDKRANWSIFAVEGWDHICLMKSVYKHHHSDQFKAFSLGGDQTRYIELEFTSPRVQAGKQSTLVYQTQFIPITDIVRNTNFHMKTLSKENIRDELTILVDLLKKKLG